MTENKYFDSDRSNQAGTLMNLVGQRKRNDEIRNTPAEPVAQAADIPPAEDVEATVVEQLAPPVGIVQQLEEIRRELAEIKLMLLTLKEPS